MEWVPVHRLWGVKTICRDFGGIVIVERIDDLEVVVMKIGGEVIDFEDEMLGVT